MNVSARALDQQLVRVHERGWWEFLEAAAQLEFPDGEFDAYDLFAVGSRETNWNPRYLREPGDNGNGFGPLQIDRRSFPEFVASGRWRDTRAAILMGARVLRAKLDLVRERQGQPITVMDRRGGRRFTIAGKVLSEEEQKRVALAAYNSGSWAHYHVSKGRSPDHGTTGKDYSQDVLERAAAARKCCRPA